MRTVRCVAILLLVLAGLTGRGQVPSVQAASAQRAALLIANAAYPDSDGELPTPIADARALGDELKRREFTVEIAENVTKDNMQAAIDRFLRRIEPGSVALVFFSGYGIQVARKNYLIPVDARIWGEQDVLRDGLGVDGLLADIAKRGANTRITILDASRRNPFERRFRSFSTGLAPTATTPGTLTLYSAAAGSVVNETNATRSLFVTELIKQIGILNQSAEQAFRACRDAVSRATRSQQLPALASGLEEPFFFDPSQKGSGSQSTRPADDPKKQQAAAETKEPDSGKTPPDTVWSDPTTSKPGGKKGSADATKPNKEVAAVDPDASITAEDLAVRDFDAAARIGTKSAYEDFLSRHPSGSLASRARAEIARIEAAEHEASKEASKETQKETSKEPSRESAQPKPFSSVELKRKNVLDARIAKDSRDELAYYERGQFFAQRGDAGLAIADFDQSLKLNSNNPEAFNNRCWMRAVANDLERALEDCNQALKLRPNFVDALDSRGFVHLKVGAFRAAVDDYDAALRVESNHSSALYGRGLAYRKLGKGAQAEQDVAAALQLNPSIDKEFAVYGLR